MTVNRPDRATPAAERATRFDAELVAAQRIVAAATGGILWVGEPGSGKGEILARVAEWARSEHPESRIVVFGRGGDDALDATGVRALRDLVSDQNPLIAIVHDLDLATDRERSLVIDLAAERRRGLVLLATARRRDVLVAGNRAISIRALQPISPAEAVELLSHDHGLTVAPHVASALCHAVVGNAGSVVELARILSPGQRAGTSALPDPLPVTPLVAALWAEPIDALDGVQRAALLVGAVAVADRTEVLCAAAELDVDAIIRGGLASFFTLVAGRFEIADPRIRSYVHATATVAQRTDAHSRLARVHLALGEKDLAAWHTSLASLAGDPSVIARLVGFACRTLAAGNSSFAFAIAREASSQTSRHGDRAALVAGIAALESGCADDAVEWLSRAMRSSELSLRARALGPFVAAVVFSRGHLPDSDVTAALSALALDPRPRVRLNRVAADIGIGLAVSAALASDREDEPSTRTALAALRSLQLEYGLSPALGDTAELWCRGSATHTTIGNRVLPDDSVFAPWEGYARIASALALLDGGDNERAARMVAGVVLDSPENRRRPFRIDGPATASPLFGVHVRATAALVDLCAGAIDAALATLDTARFSGPLDLALAGRGAAALTRARILTDGAAPEPVAGDDGIAWRRRESLVDRAVLASLADDGETAAALLGLANEQRPETVRASRALPAIDETALWLLADRRERAESVRTGLLDGGRPGELLRAEVALAGPSETPALWAAAAASRPSSPFDRALTEFELARMIWRVGDETRANTHRLMAVELLMQCGARALAERCSRMPWPGTMSTALARPSTRTTVGAADEQSAAWTSELTAREREIVAMVARGRSNRDVADSLHLSVRTVEVHLGRVFSKLGVHSRTELSYLTRQPTTEIRHHGS